MKNYIYCILLTMFIDNSHQRVCIMCVFPFSSSFLNQKLPIIQIDGKSREQNCSLIDFTGTHLDCTCSLFLALARSLIYMFTHSGGEMGSSDSANQRPLLPSVLRMLLEGRGGCRGTRRGGGGKSWLIRGGQGRQGWSRRLFWKLPAAVSAIRIKPVPGRGEEEVTVDFCQASPVPAVSSG